MAYLGGFLRFLETAQARKLSSAECTVASFSAEPHAAFVNFAYTVDLEIFVVKMFSWFAQTTKIKKHEIYFATDNHYSQNISVNSTAQLANYYARDGLFFDTGKSLELMANA